MGVLDGIEAHSMEGFGATSVCDCQAISMQRRMLGKHTNLG